LTRLRDLLPECRIDRDEVAALEIAGLTADSRLVRPGFAFFALPGAKADGLAFARDAEARGAVAIVMQEGSAPAAVSGPAIPVADARRALALAASVFYPRQPATEAAVTGTSGKTSVAAFVRQIWARLGHRAAAVGTTGVIAPGATVYGQLTTPDPTTLHRVLDSLAGEGVTHLVMEASSHGLDQKRLDGVRLSAGAFTNLSRDHLDYHASLEAYLQAKLRLFEVLLAPGRAAVVDVDGDAGRRVAAACRARGLRTFETGRGGADLRLTSIEPDAGGATLTIEVSGRRRRARLPLAGDFMASNALVAAGLCLATGADEDPVFDALETLEGAPGRLERVAERRGAPIFIDYAHKPDALEKALQALRPLVGRRLVVVFGCGGDRDPGKRPLMGEIAAREADLVIVTDDNPRSESPAAIRAAILAAAPRAIEIGDRRAAIGEAVRLLEPGDVLVIAGKGHETGQIVGDRTLPFSDHEEVRKAIEELGS
jgi:UDP-N-acetylmuramoyl-L-alanyl-D-glutamate--2,6-diaminopimelate ligase